MTASPEDPVLPIFDQNYKEDTHCTWRAIVPPGMELAPVRLPSGERVWLVTSYRLARELLDDVRFGKQAPGSEAIPEAERASGHPIFRHMLTMDAPQHSRLRGLVARDFVQRRIRQYAADMQRFCDEHVARLREGGKVELVAEFATPLALSSICLVLGLPAAAASSIRQWNQRLLAAEFHSPEQFPAIGAEMAAYFDSLLVAVPAVEADTVLSRLAKAVKNGELSRDESFAMLFLLVSAGYETSVNLLCNGILSLLRNPTQWSALCAQPDLTDAAVDELLRFESPLEMATPRFARCAVQLAGRTIAAGDRVFVALAAANRDAAEFTDPDTLDIRRENAARHTSFGYGPHYCLGAHVARQQARIAIRSLAEHCPQLALDPSREPPRWYPGLIMRGLTHLHLVV